MDHTITIDRLFNEWCNHQDEPWVLAVHLRITPAQLADLTDNPEFARRVAAWERLTRAHREDLVFNHQQAAAVTLRQTMSSPDPIEARRAATTLAHLSRNMLPGRTALQRSASRSRFAQAGTVPDDTAQGGTALQSGASDDPTPPQSAAPSPPSIPPSTQPATPPEPPTAPLPFDAPLPLPLVASSSQVITKLTARAGAAARASGP